MEVKSIDLVLAEFIADTFGENEIELALEFIKLKKRKVKS